MAIAGPNIQMPPSLSEMFNVDEKGNIVSMKQPWASFFHSLQQTAWNGTRSGSTASRPTASTDGRYVGMSYFDTTLGLPVFLKIASTNVWVKADGTVA